MKRGFFSVLVLSILITFGGFVNPEKVSATITEKEKNDTADWIISILKDVKNDKGIISINKTPQLTYLNKLKEEINNEFSLTSNNPSTTISSFQLSVLEKFNAYLYDIIKIPPPTTVVGEVLNYFNDDKDVALLDIAAISPLINTLRNNNAVMSGEITQEKANASNSLSNSNWSQASEIAGKTVKPISECGLDDLIACVNEGFASFINVTLLEVGSWLLYFFATLLDWSITSGIRDFSTWVPDNITDLWKMVRDVLYLCVVFIGLWLAFMYIIGKDDKFKKFIPWLIIFALFVNFSLPITKAMIDMSNIVALNIYSSALPNASVGAGTALFDKIGLSKLGVGSAKVPLSVSVSVLSVIFVFFAAWVFFQMAILMLIRTISLTLILIASPFLLIDSISTIPAFGEFAKKIRAIFFNQLFMADVFMIMLYITLSVMDILKPDGAITQEALLGSGGVGSAGLIFGISMSLVLLYFMLKITKAMSGEVGSLVTGAVNTSVVLLAGGVAMRGGAMLGRATLGRGAAAVRDSSWVKNNQDSFIGRKAYDLSHSVANSSFDARNSGVAKAFSSKTGIGFGKGPKNMRGVKVGYDSDLKAKIKDRSARYGRIETEHSDGRMNLDGSNAKARFYNKAGGVLGIEKEKEALRSVLRGEDQTEALKMNRGTKNVEKSKGKEGAQGETPPPTDFAQGIKNKLNQSPPTNVSFGGETYEANPGGAILVNKYPSKPRTEKIVIPTEPAQEPDRELGVETPPPTDFKQAIMNKQNQSLPTNVSFGGETYKASPTSPSGIVIPT